MEANHVQNTDERIKKMGYLDTGQYYSVIKKDQIMTFPSTRRKVEVIILSEVGETGQDKNHMVSLLGGI